MKPQNDLLQKLFDADRVLRDARTAFLEGGDAAARLDAIEQAITASWKGGDDLEEHYSRLMHMGELLGEVGGPRAIQLLLRLLDHEEAQVRMPAANALEDIAYARYAEVARAIEKLIDEGKATTALSEVPYLLAEVGEPGGVKLCVKLLAHADADVVASAVEALAQLGDASVVKSLERLKSDKRRVSIDDDPEAEQVTLGELVGEAIEHLRGLDM